MPDSRSDAIAPACGPDDLVVMVRWERDGTGLRGQVIAENISDRACQLASKPDITPLRPDGSPLPTRTIVTTEFRNPGYVVLQPGDQAAAQIWWGSWCGQQASDWARVSWPEGSTVAKVHGPTQPDCVQRRPDNLSSSWFDLIS
jgi:Protein of unknown function (DUF4232)